MDRHHNAAPLADRLALDYEVISSWVADAAALVPGEVRTIATEEEAGEYAETARAIKVVVAKVDACRKREKAGILEAGREVDKFFASLSGQLTPIVNALVAAIGTWQQARLAEERRAQAAEAERLRKEAAMFGEDAPPAPAPVVAREVGRVVAASGVIASASTRWVGVVVDIDKLPRRYLMINQVAIDAAIKGGAREIPGVDIREEVRTSIR